MIDIGESSSFRRAFKRLIRGTPALEQAFRERIAIFRESPFTPLLHTHKLSGRLKNQWAFSLNHKLRIIFTFSQPDFVILEDIGSHDDVY